MITELALLVILLILSSINTYYSRKNGTRAAEILRKEIDLSVDKLRKRAERDVDKPGTPDGQGQWFPGIDNNVFEELFGGKK